MEHIIQVRGDHEFTTRVMTYPDAAFFTSDAEMEKDGWRRTWADVTQEGVFVVYRRERVKPSADQGLLVRVSHGDQ